jgi:methyl-accepting chemotaxis protein
MDNLLILFIALTAFAVLLQAGLLGAMYLAMRKSTARMESVVSEVKTKALPAIDSAQTMLTEVRPKLQVIAENLQETTTMIRDQLHRVDATVTETVDRARLQVIRADELLSRTLDKVEQTSEVVQKTVVSPVRQVTGLMRGITAGVEFFFSGRGPRNGRRRESGSAVPQDEMFI